MTPIQLFYYFLAVSGGLGVLAIESLIVLILFLLVRGVIVQTRRG